MPLSMPASLLRAARLGLVLAAGASVGACGSVDSVSNRIASSITPYKVEIVQGNFISREQVAQLKPGMSRLQVRDILGTPLVADIFHADRWDYVFTLRRKGVQTQERKLTVFFKGDALDRYEGDEMPTEAEFVASLDNRRQGAKVPELQASEEQLKKFSVTHTEPPPPPAQPPVSASYPPLEPAVR
jgi:outer membrane protein assembly factor BamE